MDAGKGVRQQHGLDFEEWLKSTFFSSSVTHGPTAKWDMTGVKYKLGYEKFTSSFSGLPISVKTCKYGSSIGMGDAIRHLEVSDDFLLIIAFWEKSGSKKKVVAVKAVKITADVWHALFVDTVTTEELIKDETAEEIEAKIRHLDKTIKDRTVGYREVRKKAKIEKAEIPKMDIVLNPKIDSKNQRRLQCSLPFKVFWGTLVSEVATKTDPCILWGETVPDLK